MKTSLASSDPKFAPRLGNLRIISFPKVEKLLPDECRGQNELRHFALNGLFDVFRTSKGEKVAFPLPSPPCNVVPLFELPLENKKHPNFEWRGQGRGVDSYVSEVTLFEYK